MIYYHSARMPVTTTAERISLVGSMLTHIHCGEEMSIWVVLGRVYGQRRRHRCVSMVLSGWAVSKC